MGAYLSDEQKVTRDQLVAAIARHDDTTVISIATNHPDLITKIGCENQVAAAMRRLVVSDLREVALVYSRGDRKRVQELSAALASPDGLALLTEIGVVDHIRFATLIARLIQELIDAEEQQRQQAEAAKMAAAAAAALSQPSTAELIDRHLPKVSNVLAAIKAAHGNRNEGAVRGHLKMLRQTAEFQPVLQQLASEQQLSVQDFLLNYEFNWSQPEAAHAA